MSKDHISDHVSQAPEHEAISRKYQNSKQMFSVILEGPAVGYIKGRKKKAGRSGSRGKYISHCIWFYETHKLRSLAMEKQIRNLERRLRDCEN